MAIRYVKDFEFPSAAGFSSSAPSKVTGPMFAKGGKVEKAPKGMMVVIGIGKPKGPMKKAEGGKAVKVPLPAEDEAPYPSQWPMPSDEQINKENWNQRKAIRRAMGAKNTGQDTFAKGGDVKSVPVKDIKSGKVPQSTDEDFYGKAEDMPMPPRRPAGLKKGGMTHDDAAQDRAMIKSMVKPAALKKAMGGQAVQMAKSNAIADSLKGQKKTPYADGGVAARPFGAGARQTAPSVGSTQYKADGGPMMSPRIASPLQAMAARPRGVPVAPRAPMIPQQTAMPPAAAMAGMGAQQDAAPGGARIGVGRARAGQPNVGAIRAAMARAASQSMPENAPSMMKKGGKVKC